MKSVTTVCGGCTNASEVPEDVSEGYMPDQYADLCTGCVEYELGIRDTRGDETTR